MMEEQTEFFTYRDAMEKVDDLFADARANRQTAERYGYDTTVGDSGVPCWRLAELLVAEAQVWATVALAATSRNREAMAAGL